MVANIIDLKSLPCFPVTWIDDTTGIEYKRNELEVLSKQKLESMGWYTVLNEFPSILSGKTANPKPLQFNGAHIVQKYIVTTKPVPQPNTVGLPNINIDVNRIKGVAISSLQSINISTSGLIYKYTVHSTNTLEDIAHVFSVDNVMVKVMINTELAEDTYYIRTTDVLHQWKTILFSDGSIVDVYTKQENKLVKNLGVDDIVTIGSNYENLPENIKTLIPNFPNKANIFAWSEKATDTIIEYYKYKDIDEST